MREQGSGSPPSSDTDDSPVLSNVHDIAGGARVEVSRFSETIAVVTSNDNASIQNDTVLMNDITREELNAKLETIETKMDARVESVSSKIEAFLAVQTERDQRFNERLASSITLSDEWNQKFRMLAEQSAQAAISADSSAKEAATLKTHFWASVVAQVLAVGAIVVGAYLANQANVLSAVSTLSLIHI